MVRLNGRLSLDGPVAVNRYRQKNGMVGCEIIITSKPGRFSAPYAENTMKLLKIPKQNIIDERKYDPKLGKLVYTTREGETFTAYHSIVFPKIVNECDKIVYENQMKWFEAMRVGAPVRCD